MSPDETSTLDRTAQARAASRAWAALLSLLVLTTLLGFSVVRGYQDFQDWPFGETQRTGDDYATLVTALAEPDNGMSVGVLIRGLPDFEQLQVVEVPAQLDLIRDFIVYGGRDLSPVFVRAIDDMVAGKLRYVHYNPVLTSAQVMRIDALPDTIESGATTLVPAAEDAPDSYRLFTDPDKLRFFLLPEEARP